MKLTPLAAISLLAAATATPSQAGGYEPYDTDRHVYIEAPAPRVVERERIIERHYYQAPVEAYVVPRYTKRVARYRDVYDDGRYYRPYDDDSWRPTYRHHW